MSLFSNFPLPLQAKLEIALAKLTPLPDELVDQIGHAHPGIPQDYLDFLRGFGVGVLQLGESPDRDVLDRPIDAAHEYFLERVFWSESEFPAPRGAVLGVSTYSDGTLYGFDSGDDWRMVYVDGRRDVVRLELSFLEFIAGVVACHPLDPLRRLEGGWVDEGGDFVSD